MTTEAAIYGHASAGGVAMNGIEAMANIVVVILRTASRTSLSALTLTRAFQLACKSAAQRTAKNTPIDKLRPPHRPYGYGPFRFQICDTKAAVGRRAVFS